MLVLTRKEGERVMIGDEIVVTIIQVNRGKIRIGIDAPAHVKIWREELLHRAGPAAPRQPAGATGANPDPSL